jgi:pentatricopeptide repeat protein
MVARGYKPNMRTMNALAHVCSNNSYPQKAFGIFDLLKKHKLLPDSTFCYHMIKACWKTKKYDLAHDTLQDMRILGVDPCENVYNLLIRICADQDNAEKAVAYIQEMEYFNKNPNIDTYSNIIYACAKRPEYYVEAFEYYKKALANGFIPDETMYNSLLYCAYQRKDLNAAVEIWEHMTSLRTKVKGVISYGTMFSCIKSTMDKETVNVGDRLWSIEQRISLAEALKVEFQRSYLKPTMHLHNCYLSIFAKAQLEEAFFKKMDELERNFKTTHFKPDLHVYHLILRMYSSAGKIENMMDNFHLMQTLNIKPTYTTHIIMLEACKATRSYDFGIEILNSMKLKGFKRPKDMVSLFNYMERVIDRPVRPLSFPRRELTAAEAAWGKKKVKSTPEEKKKAAAALKSW